MRHSSAAQPIIPPDLAHKSAQGPVISNVGDFVAASAPSPNESLSLLPPVLAGVAVAALLSPKDGYFIGNFAFYWVPQAITLGVVLFFVSRPAVLSGVAVVLALYLALYGAWVFSRPHPESMAWLGYLSSLPGAGLGAIAGALYVKRQSYKKAAIAGVVAASFTLVGLAANQIVVCSTVMYCGS